MALLKSDPYHLHPTPYPPSLTPASFLTPPRSLLRTHLAAFGCGFLGVRGGSSPGEKGGGPS